ncbi:MAG: DUF4952 domain-containing protein [Gammaproteobacteria bacterium]
MKKIIIMLIMLCPFAPSAEDQIECIDFLEAWNMKSSGLKFLGCQQIEKLPAVLLQATYSVNSSDAKNVEDILYEKFSMPRLRFVCCGWETKEVTYTTRNDVYAINMYSMGEFKESAEWESFTEFHVTVGKYLVLP